MKTYTMEVITQVLTIQAENEEQAEEKYSAYFEGAPCPCGADECECVEESEECYHTTTEE